MNTLLPSFLCLAALIAARPSLAQDKAPNPAHAKAASTAPESASIAEIVKKRDALLAQIADSVGKYHEAGAFTDEEVRHALMDLYVFRRDSAKSRSTGQEWQKRIIALEQENLAVLQKRVAVGEVTPVDALRAEERVLAAQQRLLELQPIPTGDAAHASNAP